METGPAQGLNQCFPYEDFDLHTRMFLMRDLNSRTKSFHNFRRSPTDCQTKRKKVNNFENKQFQIRHNEIRITSSYVLQL